MVPYVKFSGAGIIVWGCFLSAGQDIITPMGSYNARACSHALLGHSQHDSVPVQQNEIHTKIVM